MGTVVEEFLTTDELAKALKFSLEQIYDMVDDGMPHYRAKARGKMRFILSEVKEWMRIRRGESA